MPVPTRLLVLFTFLVVLPQASAQSSPAAAYTFGADCVEATMFVPLDPGRVRDEIGGIEGYAMTGEVSGAVLGVVGKGSCTGLEIDGQAAGEFKFSEVGVAIDSPDGAPGSHAYMFWVLWDHPGLHENACRLGACWPVTQVGFDLDPVAAGVVTLDASTPWGPSRSGMSGKILDVPVMGVGNHGVTTWTDGRHGAVRTPFTITGEVDTSGPGVLTAEPGSKLSRILGSEEVHDEVFIRRFHFEATPTLHG